MTVFKGDDAIREFLAELDTWVSESVAVYLLGGSAMTVHGLKAQTEDIDLAVSVVSEFEHVYHTLTEKGFTVGAEPTAAFEDIGRTVELQHEQRGFRIDLFEQQVVGKVWLTDRMRDRATDFWSGTHVSAYTLSDEDMFLLKAVSGGDIASGRRRDIEDMRIYAQRGIDYETVISEIDAQRPFNTGPTEAQQIRDRSHPLVALEVAVRSLSGLPKPFVDRIEQRATEIEIEYTILAAVDDGLTSRDEIEKRVFSTVQTLENDNTDAVTAAVDRLESKQILTHDGETVRLR